MNAETAYDRHVRLSGKWAAEVADAEERGWKFLADGCRKASLVHLEEARKLREAKDNS